MLQSMAEDARLVAHCALLVLPLAESRALRFGLGAGKKLCGVCGTGGHDALPEVSVR